MSQWHSALEFESGARDGKGRSREGAVLRQGWPLPVVVLTSSAQQWCSAVHPTRLPHDTRRETRGGGGGAAPSVATAGGPRLERRCAPQPRAPSEQDAHTCRQPARTTILALEPTHLNPIYLAPGGSLMFLYDRKRVFTPRSERYVD